METMTLYEAGTRSEENGGYNKFIESLDREVVEAHIETMKTTVPHKMTIVFLEKTFHLVSTTPHIIGD